jgi:hypothetical protein
VEQHFQHFLKTSLKRIGLYQKYKWYQAEADEQVQKLKIVKLHLLLSGNPQRQLNTIYLLQEQY